MESFLPRDSGREVTLYSCGPTVYSYAHIGNFRTFLMGDLLRRTLERRGFTVRHVMNITDVGHMTEDHLADATGEDKLAKAARELGWDPYKVAAHYEAAFVEDAKALRMKNYCPAEAERRELHPRATDHIPEMLAMIQILIDRGHAYADARGQVYFHVATFPEYGRLSGKVIEDLDPGARVAVREEKRDPRDFALWKVDAKHLMQWDPHGPTGWAEGEYERLRALVPQGIDPAVKIGFPGWHIECSAMARARLGSLIDLHTGGEDNIFPHHECEIAQSYGAKDHQDGPISFSNYWVHARHLLVNGAKMSKRDGTFITVRDLFDPHATKRPELAAQLRAAGFANGSVPPHIVRFALISTPFTQPMNFTVDALVQAKASAERIQSLFDRLQPGPVSGEPSSEVRQLLADANETFDEYLDDNLNMPRVFAAVFGLISEANQRKLSPADEAAVRACLESMDEVLAVLDRRVRCGAVSNDELASIAATSAPVPAPGDSLEGHAVRQWLGERYAARRAKNFARADEIRKYLIASGIEIEDTPGAVRWRLR